MSGDATLSNAGVLTIASNAIGSAEITDGSIAAADLAATAVTASNGLTATSNNITLGGTLAANTTVNLSTFNLFLNGTGALAVGTNASASKLDVEGNAAIGATYSGSTAAPTNGLIVEGIVGIGTSAPASTSGLTVNLPLASTIKDGLVISNSYNSSSSKSGISSSVSLDGTGIRYGMLNTVNSGSTGALYGFYSTLSHTGTSGVVYGDYKNISNAVGNASLVYGGYTTINNTGVGTTYGLQLDVNKPSLTAGQVYGLAIEATNNGTANSYLLYGNSNGATTGTEYGLYVTGEDYNYFSQKVGIGVNAPINRLDVEGGAVIGATYSGVNTAPTNGLLVEGTVSIGTTVTTRKLNVGGDIDASGGIYLGSVEYFQDGGANEIMTNSDLRPITNGAYSIGTSTFRWSTIYATNGTISTSDRRLKKDIHNLNYGLLEVMKLRPVSFQWKDKVGQRKLGLIAQEVYQVLPEIVDNPKEGYMGILYSDLVPVTVKAIQEQQVIIERQQVEINELKAKINDLDVLKQEIESLKNRVGAEARNTKKRKSLK
jgi:Chaperone of endosialidase